MLIALSTADNPFNPFTQEQAWLSFDEAHGYFSRNYLARIARTSSELSDADYEAALEQGVDDIIKFDPTADWIKVKLDESVLDSKQAN